MKHYLRTLSTLLIAAFALAACDQPRTEIVYPEIPTSLRACPDPKDRQPLPADATPRDLAESLVETVDGWAQCHSAVEGVDRLADRWGGPTE